MLFGFQTPLVNAQISWEATSWTSSIGTGPNKYTVISGIVNGIETSWTLNRIRLSRLVDTRFLAKIESINDTLASDLVSAMETYESNIDAVTARSIAAMANCLARLQDYKKCDL